MTQTTTQQLLKLTFTSCKAPPLKMANKEREQQLRSQLYTMLPDPFFAHTLLEKDFQKEFTVEFKKVGSLAFFPSKIAHIGTSLVKVIAGKIWVFPPIQKMTVGEYQWVTDFLATQKAVRTSRGDSLYFEEGDFYEISSRNREVVYECAFACIGTREPSVPIHGIHRIGLAREFIHLSKPDFEIDFGELTKDFSKELVSINVPENIHQSVLTRNEQLIDSLPYKDFFRGDQFFFLRHGQNLLRIAALKANLAGERELSEKYVDEAFEFANPLLLNYVDAFLHPEDKYILQKINTFKNQAQLGRAVSLSESGIKQRITRLKRLGLLKNTFAPSSPAQKL